MSMIVSRERGVTTSSPGLNVALVMARSHNTPITRAGLNCFRPAWLTLTAIQLLPPVVDARGFGVMFGRGLELS